MTVALILVATVGKFGGSAIAARLTGLRWREASAIGILMNTRGLMELIILNIGFVIFIFYFLNLFYFFIFRGWLSSYLNCYRSVTIFFCFNP